MTDPRQTEEVTLFCIGGPRHGHAQVLAADVTSWLDIASGTSYYVKPMKYTERKPDLTPTAFWSIDVLVHESFLPAEGDTPGMGQQKGAAVMQLWTDVVLRTFMRERGTQIPLNEHPEHASKNGHRKLHLPPDGGNLR